MPQDQTENRLLRNVLLAFVVSGMTSQLLGPLIPFLRNAYGFSYDLSGVMLSVQSVGNLLSVLASGFLPIYLGRRRSILLTAVWMPMAYLIFAGKFGPPALLIAACFMTGLARGGNTNFSNTMVGTLPGSKAARGYNLLHGSFALGALISPLLLVLCSSLWPENGWRIMAAFLCLFALVQILVYSKMFLPPEELKKSIKNVDRSFLKAKRFWLSASILFFYISTEYAIVGWMVTYFMDIGVLNQAKSQTMNSLLWLLIFAGRMTGALVSGKISKRLLLTIDGVGFLGFFLLMFFSRSELPIIIGIIGIGFFMATIYPTAYALGSGCIKGNDFGASVMILTGSAGGIVTPALVGFVAEMAGIQAGMWVVVVVAVLLLFSIILNVYSTRKKSIPMI